MRLFIETFFFYDVGNQVRLFICLAGFVFFFVFFCFFELMMVMMMSGGVVGDVMGMWFY